MENGIKCNNAQVRMYLDHKGRFEFWRGNGYRAYLMKYKEHMSPKMAEYASSCLENVDGSNHSWTKDEVIEAMQKMKVEIPSCMTHSDVHYLANKTYAKYGGAFFETEMKVLEMVAYKLKYKARKGDSTFVKYMTHLMTDGQVIDFCEMM